MKFQVSYLMSFLKEYMHNNVSFSLVEMTDIKEIVPELMLVYPAMFRPEPRGNLYKD